MCVVAAAVLIPSVSQCFMSISLFKKWRALRPLTHDLRPFLSYRLLHDRLTEGCAIASRNLRAQDATANDLALVSRVGIPLRSVNLL
jgi:hypothetical protein